MEGSLFSTEFQLVLFVFFAIGGYLAAIKLDRYVIIGLIPLGILIGPNILQIITDSDFIIRIALLSAMGIFFVIGFDVRLEDLLSLKTGIIAFFNVIISWLGGYFISGLFGFPSYESILIGIVLTATGFTVVVSILKECNQLQTENARTIIGAAVIGDIACLLSLATITNMGAGLLSISSSFILIIRVFTFFCIGTIVSLFIISRLLEKIERTVIVRKNQWVTFFLAMMIACIYAMIADLIGISVITGVFIAGLSFSGAILHNNKILQEGAEHLQIGCMSILFLSLGVIADIHMVTIGVAIFVVILTIITIVTKALGCGISSYCSGMSFKDALFVGFGMASGGEITMIIALICLNSGIINQKIFITLVLTALFTTLFTVQIYRGWINMRRNTSPYCE